MRPKPEKPEISKRQRNRSECQSFIDETRHPPVVRRRLVSERHTPTLTRTKSVDQLSQHNVKVKTAINNPMRLKRLSKSTPCLEDYDLFKIPVNATIQHVLDLSPGRCEKEIGVLFMFAPNGHHHRIQRIDSRDDIHGDIHSDIHGCHTNV